MEKMMYAEMNVFCMLIVFILALRILRSYRSSRQETLLSVYLCTILFCASDVVWCFMEGRVFQTARVLNYFINALYFTLSALCAYFVICYVENVIKARWIRNKKNYTYAFLPALLVIVLAFASIATDWLFSIDEQGFYHRGPLYPVQPVVCCAYLVSASVHALILGRRAPAYMERETDYTVASFAIFPVLGGVGQVFFPDMPVLCPAMTLALVIIFINLQDGYITRDALTQVGNRYWLMSHLEDKTVKYRNGREGALYLIIIDIDHFKQINDSFGHVEGDRALIQVANAMKKSCRDKGGYAARIGGDEFVIAMEADGPERVEAMIRAVRREIAAESKNDAFHLTVSAGYAKYDPYGMSISDLIAAADAQLYKDKEK